MQNDLIERRAKSVFSVTSDSSFNMSIIHVTMGAESLTQKGFHSIETCYLHVTTGC